MNRKSLLLAVILTLASWAWAQTQSAPPQAPPSKGGPGGHDQMEMGHHHKMTMEMDKQHMEAMKADVDKMKASLDQLRSNLAKIGDSAEKARWQANVDLWTVMVGHMEQMMKHMGGMGPRGYEASRHNATRRYGGPASGTETGVSPRSFAVENPLAASGYSSFSSTTE